MKRLSFLFVLLAFAFISFSQNSIPSNAISTSSEKKRWDLDRYVWSHKHYKNRETDKPVIDFDAIDNWQSIGPASITPDGKYFAYTIDKGSGSNKKIDSLIVQSTENPWRKVFVGATPGFFSIDSKQYIFLDKGTLYFTSLGEDQIKKINGTMSYKVPSDNKNEWLAYQKNDHDTILVLQDLKTRKEKNIQGEYNFEFDKSTTWLILQRNNTKELELYNLKNGIDLKFSSVVGFQIDANGKNIIVKDNKEELLFIQLNPVKPTVLWTPTKLKQTIIDFKMDASGNQVVFTVEDENKQLSIWHWERGFEKAMKKISSMTKGIDDMVLQSTASFTNNGKYIQFTLKPKPDQRQPMEDAVQLDVWAYTDIILQSSQQNLLKRPKSYKGIINIKTNQLIRLESDNVVLHQMEGDFAIIKNTNSLIYGDRFWEDGYNKDTTWIMSLKNGDRNILPTKDNDIAGWFSPGGKYWVYFDAVRDCHFFSYNLETGDIKDITANVSSCELGYKNLFLRTAEGPKYTRGPAAWIDDDKGLLVYGNYDIWKLDLTGNKPASNLTSDYGRLHNIVFSLINQESNLSQLPIKETDEVLLTAFDLKSKNNGFYKMKINNHENPEVLFMQPIFMQSTGLIPGLSIPENNLKTLKAYSSNSWIVIQQTSTSAPNYFLTRDFRKYKQLTNLQPQIKYNWMTTQLMFFSQLDGTITQGVLYKPENFDSTKKYPVIVSFYGQLSDRQNQYLKPAYINKPNIFDNPAWLVSHGYLVLMPDIYFKEGEWGPSVVNTLEGAANFLKKLPYVDTSHIGATGHSNSGRFGYYLLTHSNLFTAIALGSGFTGTDIISLALSVNIQSGESNLETAERKAYGAGGLGNLWENKEKWIDHTAILQADKVTSPLLLFHNKKDGDDVRAAVELFTALRRLEKPVWWLQYDEGVHTLWKTIDQRDFTIRYTQYFDHFLKKSPKPMWMSEGIPYKLKGIEHRYELNKYNN